MMLVFQFQHFSFEAYFENGSLTLIDMYFLTVFFKFQSCMFL